MKISPPLFAVQLAFNHRSDQLIISIVWSHMNSSLALALIPKRTLRRMNGIGLKLLLSAAFIFLGGIAWGLLSLRRGGPKDRNNNSNLRPPLPLAIPPVIPDEVQLDSADPKKKFLLKTGNCSIPNVGIWNGAINRSWERQEDLTCPNEGILSYVTAQQELIVENESSFKHCCYREVIRPFISDYDGYTKSENCTPYENGTDVSKLEYFLVECYSRNSNPAVHYRFHANVFLSKVKEKISFWKEKEKPVSVAIIVLDSASRVHAFRSLNRTLTLLLNRLNFVDFKGHHDLGEPTMPNAVPLLLGAPSAEEFFKEIKGSWTEHWDSYEFIWKPFSDLNYVTMFAEDDPIMGTFNYGGQTGFKIAPTDFYPRPLFVAQQDGTVASTGKLGSCFGNETPAQFTLNYQLEILKKIHPTPSFTMTWLCKPQHDQMEALKSNDDALYAFFHELGRQKGTLENTVLILASDHGFYSHHYSQTHEGLIERRLPLLMIRIPENLSKRHPQFLANVHSNSHRITSHHDTHKTLVHISNLISGKGRKKFKAVGNEDYGYSFLDPIPVGRTCDSARIPSTMCACNLPTPNDNDDAQVPKSVQIPRETFQPFFTSAEE